MKSKQKHRIGIASIAAVALLLATFSVLPTATAGDNEEIIDGASKIESLKPGEVTVSSCDSVASDVEKRGKYEYDEVTGAGKFVEASKSD